MVESVDKAEKERKEWGKKGEKEKSKLKIGVILRGRQREKDIQLMGEHFEVKSFMIPSNVPELIENPAEYLPLDEDFFNVDMIVSYAGHPDINLELIKQAAMHGVGLLIFSGGSKAGSFIQLKREGEKHGVKVIWEEICCATPQLEDEKYSEFFKYFGTPEFEVKVENGKIVEAEVKRTAFCGATRFVAEKIKGLSIEEAPTKAGYFTQIFPCYASRGIEGGIHRAARVHKRAVEKAISKAVEKEERGGNKKLKETREIKKLN